MDTLVAIHTRRSIRHYTEQPVDKQLIDQVINAGMMAPSAGNEQPWQFIVVRNRETLEAITKAHPYAEMVRESQVTIMVCGDLTAERHKGYWVQDCAACTQNMLLAVHALGISSVWVGVYPIERRVIALRQIFNLPDHIVPFSILPIGYSAEIKEPEDRYYREKIHKEKW
jgi:nitroreductase